MRRRLQPTLGQLLLPLPLLLLAAAGSASAQGPQQQHPRGFGPRFQSVGFEINPRSKYSQMMGGAGGAGADEAVKGPHRFNISVDAGNYVSLRAFLGNGPMGKLQQLIRDEDGDADLPSVEEFLDRIAQQRQTGFVENHKEAAAGADGDGDDARRRRRLAEAEIGAHGGQHPAHARKLNVYAKDQRTLFNWEVYPDRAFGKLMFPSSYYCTGQLIGKRYVLTAAHCFYSYGKQIDGNNMYHSQFRAAYHTREGQHYYAAASSWGRLWYGTTYPEVYRNSDWAIIELEEPLGETQGYLGINPTDLRAQLPIYNKFQLIGYSEDGYSQTAGKDPQCSLEDAYQGVYFHNCDCAAGASGGALLDPSFNVIGINTAHVMPSNPALLRAADFNPSYPNIAVPAYQFMPTYAHILTQMS